MFSSTASVCWLRHKRVSLASLVIYSTLPIGSYLWRRSCSTFTPQVYPASDGMPVRRCVFASNMYVATRAIAALFTQRLPDNRPATLYATRCRLPFHRRCSAPRQWRRTWSGRYNDSFVESLCYCDTFDRVCTTPVQCSQVVNKLRLRTGMRTLNSSACIYPSASPRGLNGDIF